MHVTVPLNFGSLTFMVRLPFAKIRQVTGLIEGVRINGGRHGGIDIGGGRHND